MNLDSEVLLLLSIEVRYTTKEDDIYIATVVSVMLGEIEKSAVKLGQAHRFLYLNYASADQDVFEHPRTSVNASIGWSTILETKTRYDPLNVFGTQIKDSFRIS